MDKQELDGVRQLLETALKNLSDQDREGKASPDGASLFVDRSGSLAGSQAPLIVILAPGSNAQTNGPEGGGLLPAGREPVPSDEKAGRMPALPGSTEKKHSHPGLERFIIQAASRPSVPKTCFMEPGRVCVNSGACEMRGF